MSLPTPTPAPLMTPVEVVKYLQIPEGDLDHLLVEHDLPYINGYPPELRSQVAEMLEQGKLGPMLAERYPGKHEVRSNRDLGDYVQKLKARHLRIAAPLGKVLFDDRLHIVHKALGLHVTTTRQQGNKTRKRREMRVASLFKDAAPEFLRMIVVHELAHMKHAQHDRDFYRLCEHMEPDSGREGRENAGRFFARAFCH